MQLSKSGPGPGDVSKSISIVLTILVLLGTATTANASAYSSLIIETQATISSPLVIIQNGTAGTSTTYTNGTKATVSVAAEDEESIWISGNDDYVRKLNMSNLGGPEIFSWDTSVSYPLGCEYRIEDENEYIYITNYHQGPDADKLIKFHANNGSEVTKWDISDYSGNAFGLAWNGSRWFIADGSDDRIYQVDPADPTVQERDFNYAGIVTCEGLAWDGSYLWAVDSGTDKAYQIDIYGNIQTSWDFTPASPTGVAYDSASGHLWIVSDGTDLLYEYYTNGTEIGSWDPTGTNPEGVAYSSVAVKTTYDHVLRVNNTVTDSWQVRLEKYSDSSVSRLQNCTIYFHNSTDGTSGQIVIENGSFESETGPWYDLDSLETIYIAMTVEANSTGIAYIDTYLEIRATDATAYVQYEIAYEIT